jgi:hypothetical protein
MLGVILQPSYIPWRGYFDLIQRADTFVFYDDVQYDKHGWRNRNKIRTHQGSQWLTIPVASKGNVTEHLLLADARIVETQDWAKKHWASIRQAYAKAPHFRKYEGLLEQFYAPRQRSLSLIEFTIETTLALAAALGIQNTRFVRSSELKASGDRTDRLVSILQQLGATRYLSGPSARSYLDANAFEHAGIKLEYMTYDYPEYEQMREPFDGQVSVLDLLFMKGERAPDFIWGGGA